LDSAAAVVAAAVVAGALDELLPQAVSPRTNAAASTGVMSFFIISSSLFNIFEIQMISVSLLHNFYVRILI
jgi:hypothetical protein